MTKRLATLEASRIEALSLICGRLLGCAPHLAIAQKILSCVRCNQNRPPALLLRNERRFHHVSESGRYCRTVGDHEETRATHGLSGELVGTFWAAEPQGHGLG